MAQHGYLHDEYDRDFTGDDDRRDERWRDRDDDRNFMFDRNRRDRNWRGNDRGFFSRMGNEAGSWFRDEDELHRGRGRFLSEDRSDAGSGVGGRSEWGPSPRSFRSHPDDHYRSWRDKKMAALDSDYADYCREREQQFHSDFDSWRRNRSSQSPSATTNAPGSDLGAAANAGVGTTTSSMTGTAGVGSAGSSGASPAIGGSSPSTGDATDQTARADTGTGSGGRSGSRSRS